MKKILSFFIAVLALLTLYGCVKDEPKVLTAPTNVAISEEGYITWNEVENATSYIVTINGESFVVTTNSYQVKDLKKDFSFTVKALADGYTTSPDSDAKSFTGTAASDKEAMTDYSVATILGTRDKAEDKDAFDRQAKMLQTACFKAYEYGVDIETLKTVIDPLVESEEKDAQTVLLTLLFSVSSLDKDKIVGMTVFADYYAQIFLEELKSLFTDEKFAKIIDDTAALLVRNDCEIAVALGHILCQGVNVYNRLSLKVIPQLVKLITEGSIKNNPKLVVEIKNSIVKALLDNPIADEDLAVILTFLKDWLPVAAPLFEEADYEGINIKEVFDKLEEALSVIDMNELAKTINKEIANALKSLDFITEELLTEAFKYENNVQVIAYIVLNGLKGKIPTVDIKGQDLINVAELVYGKLVASDPATAKTLKEFLGLTDDDYKALGDNIAKLVNNLLNVLGNFVKDDNNIDSIVKALNLMVDEVSNTGYDYVASTEIANNPYLSKIIEAYGISFPDNYELGNAYVIKEVSKEANAVVIKQLSVTINDVDSNGAVSYYYEDSTVTLTNLSDLVPLATALVDALKAQADVTAKDIQDVLKVLVKTTIIPEGMARQFLTFFANAKEEDMKAVYNDLLVVVKAFVEYVKKMGIEEFVYGIGSDNFDVIYGFFTTENAELVKTLVNDLGTLLDNAQAFPLTLVLGEGMEMTFQTKDEFVTQIGALVDALVESNNPSTGE